MKNLAKIFSIGLLTFSTASYSLEITPTLGYRGGGEFIDTVVNKKHTTASSEVYGLIISGEPYDGGKTFEVYYSHQSSEIGTINIPPAGPTPGSTTRVPLSIDYLHFGGTAPISEADKLKTFVSGGIGFTYMNPGVADLESDMRASLSIGLGLKMPISKRIAFRLESRLLATLFNNNSSIFCSGGCVIQVNGSAFYQGEVFAGLAFKF